MGKEIKKTSGQIIKEAREKKQMTINDLAFALDKENIKLWEKRIKSWENDKDFPELNILYQLSYIIDINPTELITFRDKFRKRFIRTKSEVKAISASEEFTRHLISFLAFFMQCLLIFIFIAFWYFALKGVITFSGGTKTL